MDATGPLGTALANDRIEKMTPAPQGHHETPKPFVCATRPDPRALAVPGRDRPGEWKYETNSNRPELKGKTGGFNAAKPSPGNHGPVRVRNRYHFAYADGTPYFQVGTTCYAWVHQGDSLEEQTLDTLKHAPF